MVKKTRIGLWGGVGSHASCWKYLILLLWSAEGGNWSISNNFPKKKFTSFLN